MSVVAIASASGSPGVTTLAALIGVVDHKHPIVIEASPFGGTLAASFDLHWNPGLASLAAAAGDEISPSLLAEHVQTATTGLNIVAGPASSVEAGPALAHVVPLLQRALATPGWNLVLDCGTLWPGSPAWPLSIVADITLLVVRQHPDDPRETAARVSHAHALGVALIQSGAAIGIALIGGDPYPSSEVAAAVGAAVIEVIPDDRGAVRAALRSDRRRSRNKVLDSVERLSRQLRALTEPNPALIAPVPGGWATRPAPAGTDRSGPRQRAERWA